jgi:putative peptide zinc metalloprotease protein
MDRAVTTATPPVHPPKSQDLPRLREDLCFRDGRLTPNSEPTYLIYDGLRHRFISIDAATFTVLALWPKHKTVGELALAATAQLGQHFATSEIESLIIFLDSHDLIDGSARHDWTRLAGAANQRAHGPVMALVHNYLFFRIPLFSPERSLRSTLSVVEPFFHRRAQLVIVTLGILGLFLVSRQWDEFIQQARGLATLQGAAAFGIILFVVKALHELAHGYAAVRYACRVPTMGMAFMMMAPLLYTDVTDAWRLTDRRQRLVIDAAGVILEIGLACIATFLWVFLPDGVIRHIAFLIATTSWTMSLAINLNPFMRFDGYYIMSDLIGVPNLQSRAFKLGTWKLRELLFRPRQPSPEVLARWQAIILIIYAWSVWIYRFFLFIGIAALVYGYFFKALGIIMFMFEVGYFLVKPVWTELRAWWRLRRPIMTSRRTYATVGLVASGLLVMVVPWSTTVSIPAVLEAAHVARVYPPRPTRVVAVHVKPGQMVHAGDPLLTLDAPEIANEAVITKARYESVRLRLNRQSADSSDRDDNLVLEGTKASLVARMDGIAREQAELEVRSPFDGVVAELNPNLQPDRWIGAREMIALVRGDNGARVIGYLSEADLWRVERGAKGRFVPESPFAPTAQVTLDTTSLGSSATLEVSDLAISNGGSIEAQNDNRRGLIPTSAIFLVTMSVDDDQATLTTTQRGRVLLTGHAESFATAIWRRVLKVLVRESSA